MPIYEYVCSECKYRYEVVQSITDDDVPVCPRCAAGGVRIVSKPAKAVVK